MGYSKLLSLFTCNSAAKAGPKPVWKEEEGDGLGVYLPHHKCDYRNRYHMEVGSVTCGVPEDPYLGWDIMASRGQT